MQDVFGHVIETFIYHVEFGINMAHEDFRNRPGKIEWLYTNLTENMRLNEEKEIVALEGHSTCTASKAGGMIYGASKSATLVVVKLPDLNEGTIPEALPTILQDIRTKGRQGRSVISISWGFLITAAIPIPEPWDQFEQDLLALYSEQVITVCSAGNAAKQLDALGHERVFIDKYPAVFESQYPRTILPVSNCDIHGRKAPTSQIERSTPLFAPGVDIKCASSTANQKFRVETGTSFCKSSPKKTSCVPTIIARGAGRVRC